MTVSRHDGGEGGGNTAAEPAELTALIAHMRDQAPELDSATWQRIGEWGSFFANFVHTRADTGLELAIKFGKGWTAADAEYVAAEIGRVRKLFSTLPGGTVDVPPVLGYSTDPAAIALPFVDGDNLFAALGDRHHPVHSDREQLLRIVELAGEALGAYHAAEEPPGDAATRAVARQDMAAAARRAGYRTSLVDRLESAVPVVRGYRLSHNDFTIRQQASATGHGWGLVILDPPHVRKFDHLHRDLSAFTLALHRALVGERYLPSGHLQRIARDELEAALLTGYRITGPARLDTPLDTWLLRFYELSRIGSQLSGKLRGRRWRQAIPNLRWWLGERRSLGVPPTM